MKKTGSGPEIAVCGKHRFLVSLGHWKIPSFVTLEVSSIHNSMALLLPDSKVLFMFYSNVIVLNVKIPFFLFGFN